MAKKILILFFVLGNSLLTNAQISNEIKTYVDSTEIIVNNGRKLLLSKLSSKEYLKTQDIYHYLKNKTINSGYKSFDYSEEMLITMLSNDWDGMLYLMKNYDSEVKNLRIPDAYPVRNFLNDMVKSQQENYWNNLNTSDLPAKEKLMIELFLLYMNGANMEMINYQTKMEYYQKNYKNSEYDKFLTAVLPYRKPLKSSWAFEMGSGTIFPSGKIQENFVPNFGFNASMDFNVNKLYISVYAFVANVKLKIPFSTYLNNTTVSFARNENFSYFNGGAKVGCFLVRSKRFHLAPFISLTGSYIESKLFDDDDDDNEYKAYNSVCFGVGLHTEMKILDFTLNDFGGKSASYISLKLDAGYNEITSYKNGYSGDLGEITFGLVWGIGHF